LSLDRLKGSRQVSASNPIGGKKVGHPVPIRREQEISFDSIGGECVRRACDDPMNKPVKVAEA